MDKQDSQSDKLVLNRPKSYIAAAPNSAHYLKLKNESSKRKFLNDNDAVRSLDLALGRLNKSNLVPGELIPGSRSLMSTPSDLFMDATRPRSPTSVYSSGTVNDRSLMSMNLSHYELMRNLSTTNSNADMFSDATSTMFQNRADANDDLVRHERLEKYFRSSDMWMRRYCNRESSNLNPDIPDK